MNYCPTCGAENRDTARFCGQCGLTFSPEIRCPSCGVSNPAQMRFCQDCGAPLRGSTPAAGLTGLLPANALLSNRYVILRRVGKGGMGAVYQASDTRLSSKVWAIKEMSDAALPDPVERQQAREAFQREAQMLATLDHPNLPKVNDFFIESGKLYLVMDYIDGRTLQDVLEASPGPLPEAQVLEWAGQLCEVLDYLHRCTPPIIFRDLKPGNIMLDKSNRVKLIDFGVARLFKTGQARDTANFGTAGYAPPEQYGKGQTDGRSDIYALGVTLHELLTRYDPAMTPFNLPPARNVNPAIPIHIEQAIVRATQPLQANRFQRALEMKAALFAPIVGQPPVPPPLQQPQPAPTPRPVASSQPAQSPPAAAKILTSVPTIHRTPALPANFEPEMIVIPAGEFLMGSDKTQDMAARSDEMPQHRVYLDEYAIGKYPITQVQYAAFIQATNHRVPSVFLSGKVNWDKGTRRPPIGKENHPVIQVDWKDAVAYCQWLAQVTGKPYRLPTEAEWEKAARGTDGRIYPWGNATPDANRLNFNENVGATTKVGKYPSGASPYGVLDMAGNVWEWAADWYGEKYPSGASSPDRNPTGSSSGKNRVLRGGGWINVAYYVRASYRSWNDPVNRDVDIGFRCVCSTSP